MKKINFIEKFKTYFSYNKYKLPIIFALIGLIFLTAFPTLHYEHWYRVESKFNAVSVFLLMLLSLVQLVNAINLSGKKSVKSEKAYTYLYTGLNVVMIGLAYLYIQPYFKQFDTKYLNSIVVIVLGIVFFLIGNVFAFIYLGYDVNRNVKELLKQALEEEKNKPYERK